MAFNHRLYLDKFIADYKAGKVTPNNSVARIERSPARPSYQIIGVHHLTPAENVGKHNLYLDVVDITGKRRPEKIEWGWEGQKPTEHPNPVILDKPPNEPAGNISIHFNQIVWARVLGKDSDKIYNVTTKLPDEGPGNTLGHHSHYVVWLWDEGAPIPPDPEPPGDCAELQAVYDALVLKNKDLRFRLQTIEGIAKDNDQP